MHKPGCAVTEDGQRLRISDLGSRGIVPSVAKSKALISFAVTAKLICVFVCAYANVGFLMTRLNYVHAANQILSEASLGLGERLHLVLSQIGSELRFPWQQIAPIDYQ